MGKIYVGCVQPLAREPIEHVLPAETGYSQDFVVCQLYIVEGDLGSVGFMLPHLLELAPGNEPWRGRLHCERGHRSALPCPSGHQNKVCRTAVRDERLRAVKDPARPVSAGGCANR